MKILIIATPRSGSSTLTSVLTKKLKCNSWFEPYNFTHPTLKKRVPFNKPEGRIVVKTMINQVPYKNYSTSANYIDFYKQEIKNYDRVIILTRKDILSAYESYNFKVKKDPHGNWHSSYIYRDVDFDSELYSQYITWTSKIIELSFQQNIPITWYEDLYSGNKETLSILTNQWNIGINESELLKELNRYKKYRLITYKNTLI